MKLIIGAVCLTLALAVVTEEIHSLQNLSFYDYHRRIGILEAKKIKKLEFNKIAGGWISDVSETPYQAGILIHIFSFLESVCGAALISSTRLLTAAHCHFDGIFTAQFFTIVLGSNDLFRGGLRINTTDIVVHPNWQPATIANDIAVIRVSTVTFNKYIQLISLPRGDEIFYDFVNWRAISSGYGSTNSGGNIDVSQPISSMIVSVISNDECNEVFGGIVRDTNICTSGAGGKGTCRGDSGGPLVVTRKYRKFLIGVASFGYRVGCQAGFPSAFTRVTSYLNWIQTQ